MRSTEFCFVQSSLEPQTQTEAKRVWSGSDHNLKKQIDTRRTLRGGPVHNPNRYAYESR